MGPPNSGPFGPNFKVNLLNLTPETLLQRSHFHTLWLNVDFW